MEIVYCVLTIWAIIGLLCTVIIHLAEHWTYRSPAYVVNVIISGLLLIIAAPISVLLVLSIFKEGSALFIPKSRRFRNAVYLKKFTRDDLILFASWYENRDKSLPNILHAMRNTEVFKTYAGVIEFFDDRVDDFILYSRVTKLQENE